MAAPALTNYADGVGAVNGDNLNTFVQGGVLLAQLQLFPGAWNGQVVYLGGYTSTGDGGQGFFWWNSTSTATSNGVTVMGPGCVLTTTPLGYRRFGTSPQERAT